MQLLRRLGYAGEATPDALEKLFFAKAQRLNGPIIDDRPLSESQPVRPYAADGVRNYLDWLADTAETVSKICVSSAASRTSRRRMRCST